MCYFCYQIRQPVDIYRWMRSDVLPGLYYSHKYNGENTANYDHKFIANTYGMRLGPPRLRQLRMNNGQYLTVLIRTTLSFGDMLRRYHVGCLYTCIIGRIVHHADGI